MWIRTNPQVQSVVMCQHSNFPDCVPRKALLFVWSTEWVQGAKSVGTKFSLLVFTGNLVMYSDSANSLHNCPLYQPHRDCQSPGEKEGARKALCSSECPLDRRAAKGTKYWFFFGGGAFPYFFPSLWQKGVFWVPGTRSGNSLANNCRGAALLTPFGVP